MIFEQAIQKGEFEKVNVQFISILRTKQPANRRPVVIKATDDGDAIVEFAKARITKIKKDGGKPLIYFVGYEPDVYDTQDDVAKAAVIKDMAHRFLKNGFVNMVDEDHDFIPGKGQVVESFILNSTDDDHFQGVRKGAWVGAIEPSDDLVPFLDEITGVSIAGTGAYKSTDGPENMKPVVREATIFKPNARSATLN